jgi:outer membrane receptor protein involved in Fe transport
VYSHQIAQGVGAVTGGLTDFSPPPDGNFYLDHDQRNTLSAGFDGNLPWRSFAAVMINYGSGFLNGDGPSHLPPYYTLDLSVGESFRENWTVRFIGTNITHQRYMLDTSNTFGGTHLRRSVYVLSAGAISVSLPVHFQFAAAGRCAAFGVLNVRV